MVGQICLFDLFLKNAVAGKVDLQSGKALLAATWSFDMLF
jgi:hypothetical protein